jgi:cbb3-type cytochrome oxidase cytochrome c subunit
MAVHRGTKSEAAVEILEKIGAISASPPSGWLQQAQNALERKGISMHPQSIYGVRAKALKIAKAEKRAQRHTQRQDEDSHEEQETTKSTNGFVSISVADLLIVKEFIHEFGGVERVKNALQAFDTLTTNKD